MTDTTNTDTTKDMRSELRKTGFRTIAYVSLQGPSGVENHLRVSMTAVRDAMKRADANNHGKLRATVSYDDSGYRYINIDGWQAGAS